MHSATQCTVPKSQGSPCISVLLVHTDEFLGAAAHAVWVNHPWTWLSAWSTERWVTPIMWYSQAVGGWPLQAAGGILHGYYRPRDKQQCKEYIVAPFQYDWTDSGHKCSDDRLAWRLINISIVYTVWPTEVQNGSLTAERGKTIPVMILLTLETLSVMQWQNRQNLPWIQVKWLVITKVRSALFVIVKCGIARYLCAMHLFKVRASSSLLG